MGLHQLLVMHAEQLLYATKRYVCCALRLSIFVVSLLMLVQKLKYK